MHRWVLVGALAFMAGACSTRVELKGQSQPMNVRLDSSTEKRAQKPALPAHLVLLNKAFEEPDQNRMLDAEETGFLVFTVHNQGLGPGKVEVRITPLGDMEHVRLSRHLTVGVLPVGQEKEVRIPIIAGADVADGRREMRVEVIEGYTGAVNPFSFSFTTHGLVAPDFRVILRDYDDGRFFAGNTPDGRIRAGELVKVVANVQNVGGIANDVSVVVESTSDDVRYARDLESSLDNHFYLGTMEPGAHRDVSFYFFTSPLLSRDQVELWLRVRESRQRYGVDKTLTFDIGESVRTEEVLAVQAIRQERVRIDLVEDALVDIEQVPDNSKTRLEQGIAVIFGIEDYRYTFPAAYKNRDATLFYRYCRDVLGIPEERIVLRTNSDATKAEFDYIFEPASSANPGWLKKRLAASQRAEDIDLIVYLAGHGFPDLASGRPYLIPYDVRPEQATNGVSLEGLYQTLSAFGCRSVTVFVEACFSGASGYDKSGNEKLLALNMNPVFPVPEAPMVGDNMAVFTAASDKEASNNRDDLKHGIFTYCVLKGLGGAADVDGNQQVTIEELFRYVAAEVPRRALLPPLDREQNPQLLPSLSWLASQGRRVLVEYGN